MTYGPSSRVLVTLTPEAQPRKARVVSKVNDLEAYVVRLGDGRRLTVQGSTITDNNHSNTSER